ncbi:MAG TPA: Maf family protein [Microthrixaceae bacterium]|nr:Maf family protein [Microthrixaceae bacterium]HMS89720.1 Maf family protein [Acidimicrobiales bacterium]
MGLPDTAPDRPDADGRASDRSAVAGPPIVLASGSRYRAQLLADAGIPVEVMAPEVDERALDHRLDAVGPDGLAVELALLKAAAVAPRCVGRIVVAADQVGVLAEPSGRWRMLTQKSEPAAAVEQLTALSGRRHHLLNGVVVLDAAGDAHIGIDVQVVQMRRYGRTAAESYVERFEPFDTSGSYRLEDGEALERDAGPGSALVEWVRGENPSGVLGLPLPLLGRLLDDARGRGPTHGRPRSG